MICCFAKPLGIGYPPPMTDKLTADLASGALHDLLAEIAEEASMLILPYWRAGAEVFTKADESRRPRP